jgi:hypothetical protein
MVAQCCVVPKPFGTKNPADENNLIDIGNAVY